MYTLPYSWESIPTFCPESIVSLGSARLEIKQIYIFKALKAVETVRLSSLKLTVFAEKPTMNISFHFDASIFLASFVRDLPDINSGPEKIWSSAVVITSSSSTLPQLTYRCNRYVLIGPTALV